MLARNALATYVNQRWFFYGYVMLAVCFAGMFASGPGQSFNISVFVNPLIDELGISRTSISTAYAVGTMTAAFALPYVGRLVDRYGPRVLMLIVSFLLGVICLAFPLVIGVVTLWVGFTAVRFLGQGSMMLVSTNLASQWFSRRRGMALSITTLGFAAAQAAYPPAVQYLIAEIGWRQSWLVLGAFVWVLMLPLALLLVLNKPEDLGLLPDGDAHKDVSEEEAQARVAHDEASSFTQREAMRTVAFWVMVFALSIPGLIVTGVIFHQIDYFARQGLDPQTAANIFTVTAITMVIFLPIIGYLLDRFQTRHVVAIGLVVMAAALWAMYLADTVVMAMVYGGLLGAASASMLTNATYVWPTYFGRRHLGSIQGAAQTVAIVSGSLGPLPFGIAYDLLGSYDAAVLALSALPVAFCAVVWFTKPPVKRQSATAN